MDQDPSRLGRLAAERLLERLDHPGTQQGHTVVLPLRLVRASPASSGHGAGLTLLVDRSRDHLTP
ncbi:MAG: hypothetical protein M3Q27_11420 [Actinomycetota bacterium]|nr:hypothetical protein [Actinomycetota bacterium]